MKHAGTKYAIFSAQAIAVVQLFPWLAKFNRPRSCLKLYSAAFQLTCNGIFLISGGEKPCEKLFAELAYLNSARKQTPTETGLRTIAINGGGHAVLTLSNIQYFKLGANPFFYGTCTNSAAPLANAARPPRCMPENWLC
jgi:hypothetical protein